MRRLFLSLVGLIVFAAIANAGKVTKQQALQKAQQFMRGRNLTPANVKSLSRGQTNDDAFYIFNAENKGGYIIVSADDRTVAILGYSDRGTINAENIPENMRIWLQGYADQISALPDGYQSNSPHKTRAANSAIEPLIQTTWNQSTPYNLMCPTVGDQHCLTGCVATALAQMMYYYTWPETSPVLPAYSTLDELPATTFKWDKMKLNYSYNETGESADAVAELLRYCGQINAMSYGVESSGSYLHVNDVISLFNYSKNTRSVSRSGFTNSQWEDLIIKELEANRPVLYDGQSSSGGHQFICDGYDGNGLFHINWGWGGNYDGYFVLSLADPYENGIGGGNGGAGFSSKQSAVLGFKPATENEAWIPQMSCSSANVNTSDYSRSSASLDFENVVLKGQLIASFSGVPETTQTVETGWGLYKDGTLLGCLGSESRTIDATSYSYVSNGMTLSFGADLENGQYQLCQIFRMPSETDWNLCDNSGVYYLIAEISETALALRVPDTNTVDFTVNNISYSEDPEKDSPIEVTINITNTSESVLQNVYFWIQVDGQWQKVAGNSSSVDPNTSGDILMSFTPTYTGTYDVKVTSDSGGSEVKGTGSLTIADIGKVTIEGITYTYNMLTKKAKVTGSDNETLGEDVVIPSSIADGGVSYSVKAIANGTFANVNKIVSLVISEGVKTIGNSIFGSGNYSLKKLDIPSTITQIDEYAFANCYNLSSVIVRMSEPFAIDENVFSLINWVKNDNTDEWESVTSFTQATLCVPIGMTSKYQTTDGWKAFQTIVEGEIKEVTIDGLTYRYVTGPKTATLVKGEFSDPDLTIPSSITVEGVSYAVKAIANSVFKYGKIVNLVVSEGVETIGEMAFAYCYSLKTVDLPSTLKRIDNKAFCGYGNLSKVTVRVTEPFAISDDVFGISDWVDGVEMILPSSATLCVPVGTTSKYQTADGWKAFQTIVEGEIKEVTIDGLTYSCVTGPKTATVIKAEISDPDLTIPASITVDGASYAVKAIANSVLTYNNSVVNLVVSEGVETIGEMAFLYCYNLKTVDLPSTLKQIGDKAFSGYNKLSKVVVRMAEPFAISDNVFLVSQWNDGVETIIPSPATLCVPVGTTSKYQATAGWKEFQSMVEGDIKEVTLDGMTYSYATGPKTATIIKGEFSGSDLAIPSSITIDGVSYSVTAIGNKAFSSNYDIVNLVVPEGIETIGEMAFIYCNKLETVDLPSTLKQLDDKAFGSCFSLSKAVVRMTEPFAINDNVFGISNWSGSVETIVPSYATLYVPKGCVNVYGNTDGWNFADIVEIDPDDPEDPDDPSTDDPSTDDPSTDDPSTDDPSIDDPSTDDPSTDDPSIDESIPDEVSVTITSALQVPYCSKYSLDFTDKPELKAYVATGYDKAKGTIWLTRVKQVPAETGFLLLGDAGDYDIPTIDGVSDVYYKNMFKGTLEGTTIQTTEGDYTNYYLSKGTSGVGFYKVTNADGQKIGANRCYLPILTDIPANGAEGDAEVIKVSAAKQVPYYTSKNIDFTSLEAQGIKAYTATGYNYTSGVIWLTRVKKVPAQTGILVMADKEGEYSVPTTSVQSVYENMFTGSETAQTIYTSETVGDITYINYYLSNGASGIGFYKVTNENGVSMGANRSYLQIPKREKVSGARGMDGNASFSKMVISDNDDDVIAIPLFAGDATGISSIQFQNADQDVYYNLQGQRVDRPNKGLYIRNGKKVIIR